MTDRSFTDGPRILEDMRVRAARIDQLAQSHVAPLATFVRRVRAERGPAASIPEFDPWDGGIGAEVLFVLEAPGPKTVASGFVSRNNPDESAANFFRANAEAGIPRRRTASWNIVPWTVSDAAGRVRAPRPADIAEGIPYLAQLLGLLPQLGVVVLVGRSAERALPMLLSQPRQVRVFTCPHPSPQFVNRRPENRARLTEALRAVAAFLERDAAF
jgi:uracil-DNA glycosylase